MTNSVQPAGVTKKKQQEQRFLKAVQEMHIVGKKSSRITH